MESILINFENALNQRSVADIADHVNERVLDNSNETVRVLRSGSSFTEL